MAMVSLINVYFNLIFFSRTMNLGSLGVLLAQKIFANIDGSDGIPDWWSPLTANAYNSSRHCIANYYTNNIKTLSYNVNNKQELVQLTGEPFSLITLQHIGALRFAYTILKKTNQIKSWKMPGTKLTNAQTFFLAYAQTQCYQRQELVQFLQTQSGIYDERIALNAALVHMPEFAETFQCTLKENRCF